MASAHALVCISINAMTSPAVAPQTCVRTEERALRAKALAGTNRLPVVERNKELTWGIR
jgi:hypothetical protein